MPKEKVICNVCKGNGFVKVPYEQAYDEQWADCDFCNSQGEIIVAKHRNGSLKDIRLRFIGKYAKFSNLDSFDQDDFVTNSLQPNQDFSESMGGTYTVQSKMNDDLIDDGIDDDEDGPF